jgi:hypothetical protein
MISRIKELSSTTFGRWLLVILFLLAVGSVVGGFIVAGKQFALSLLAELAGTAFSVLLALVVIDWFLDYRRKIEWRLTGEITLRAIAVHLCEIAGALFLHYTELDYNVMEPIFAGHVEPPNDRILHAFDSLLESLREYKQPLAEAKIKSPSDIAVDYYEAVKWDLEQIRNVLTPRVLGGPKDRRLVDLLIQLDQAYRELQHAIVAHKQVCTQSVFPDHIIPLIEATRDCYDAIIERLSILTKVRRGLPSDFADGGEHLCIR